MKVFLDTNILVDLVENRQESAQAAVIHQLGEDGRIQLCASYLSYANLGYIWRKVPQHQRYERIKELCVGIDILPMDVTQLHAALTHEVKDVILSRGGLLVNKATLLEEPKQQQAKRS